MSSLHTDFAPPSWFIIWTWTTPAAPARTRLTTTTPPASTSGLQSLWAASPSGATTQGFPSAPTYRSITGESSKNDTYIFCLNTLLKYFKFQNILFRLSLIFQQNYIFRCSFFFNLNIFVLKKCQFCTCLCCRYSYEYDRVVSLEKNELLATTGCLRPCQYLEYLVRQAGEVKSFFWPHSSMSLLTQSVVSVSLGSLNKSKSVPPPFIFIFRAQNSSWHF